MHTLVYASIGGCLIVSLALLALLGVVPAPLSLLRQRLLRQHHHQQHHQDESQQTSIEDERAAAAALLAYLVQSINGYDRQVQAVASCAEKTFRAPTAAGSPERLFSMCVPQTRNIVSDAIRRGRGGWEKEQTMASADKMRVKRGGAGEGATANYGVCLLCVQECGSPGDAGCVFVDVGVEEGWYALNIAALGYKVIGKKT